jgi:hypothetical protein
MERRGEYKLTQASRLHPSEWASRINDHRAKFYKLTASGRKLQTETDKWNRMASVINSIMSQKPEEA